MITTSHAKRYAKALFELAKEKNQLDKILNEFKSFLTLIKKNAELIAILNLPDYKERENLLSGLFRKSFSDLFFNFLLIVLRNKRFELISQILDEFQKRVDTYYNRARVIVITAFHLSDDKLYQLRHDLADYLNAEVRIENQVDPTILGGIIVRLNGKLFNASLLEQFKKLRYYLIKNQK